MIKTSLKEAQQAKTTEVVTNYDYNDRKCLEALSDLQKFGFIDDAQMRLYALNFLPDRLKAILTSWKEVAE